MVPALVDLADRDCRDGWQLVAVGAALDHHPLRRPGAALVVVVFGAGAGVLSGSSWVDGPAIVTLIATFSIALHQAQLIKLN